MTIIEQFKQSKVLILGLGQTGRSFARWLHAHHIEFSAWDSRDDQNFIKSIQADDEWKTAENIYFGHGLTGFDYDIALISPGVDPRHSTVVQLASNGCELMGDVALFNRLRKETHSSTKLIAITGTNGKSTVTSWLTHVLQQSGVKALMGGNIGIPVLQLLDQPCEVWVLELSSFQLETTEELAADIAIITNIAPDHLDRYDSYNDYKKAKQSVLKQASHAIYPSTLLSDKQSQSDSSKNFSYQLVTASQQQQLTIANHRIDFEPLQFIHQLKLQVSGGHNLMNAALVAQAALWCGVSQSNLQEHLVSYKGLEHRTQLIAVENGIAWVDDSKATNVAAVVAALNGLGTENNIILLVGGVAKESDFSSLAQVAAKYVKLVIGFGQDGPLLLKNMEQQTQTFQVDTLKDATDLALEKAEGGDIVLLSPACASFDQFVNYHQRGQAFKQYVEARHVA